MARLDPGMVDTVLQQINKVQQGLRGEATEAILRAGAEVFVNEWQNKITAHNHIVSRGMIDNVKITDIKLELGGGTATITSDGVDHRGVPNQLKVNVINTGKYKKSSHFVKEAEQAAEGRAIAAMQAALDDFIERN